MRLMKRLATAMVAVVVALGLFPAAGAAYADLTTNPHPDGTYALDDFDSAYGVPGFQKGKDYYEPVIIVKGGAGTLMVTTATYRFDHAALGSLEDLEKGESIAVKGLPLCNGTLTGSRGTDIKGYVFALPMTTQQLDEALDAEEASLQYLVRYSEQYDSEFRGKWYESSKGQFTFKARRVSDSTEIAELPADYTDVIDALADVPDDLTPYTTSSAQALEAALASIDTSKMAADQKDVDAMAKSIADAVKGLRMLADYSAVDKELARIPADLSPYTDESSGAVRDAQNGVQRDYATERQDAVDAMATALKAAIDGLVEKYIPVRDAIRALPLPKKVKVSDEDAIKAAKSAYDGLPNAQKSKINKNLKKKLTNCIKAVAIVKANKAAADKAAAKKKAAEEAAKKKAAEEAAKKASDSKTGDNQSGTTSAKKDSTEVRATAANTAAIAAALSGNRGASSGNGTTQKQATSTSSAKNTDKSTADSDKSKDESDKAKDSEKDSKSEDKAKSDKEKAEQVKQGGEVDASPDGAGDGNAAADVAQQEAAVAASMPFFILGLVAAGIASFVAAFVYRNRREVKVRF